MAKFSRIISASRRTDIPAFFGEWFMKRVEGGYCLVKNPFNANQYRRVEISAKSVDAIVFWTRNPQPFQDNVVELQSLGFKFVFLITITGYPSLLDTHVPAVEKVVKGVEQLGHTIGIDKIAWRYDPILISNFTDFQWHLRNFERIAKLLKGKVHQCIVSLADFYGKTLRNLKPVERKGWRFDLQPEKKADFEDFLKKLVAIAKEKNIPIASCCEDLEIFGKSGIAGGACIDPVWLRDVLHVHFPIEKDPGQRPLCRCAPSWDIGSCGSCRHGCVYCYATENHQKALLRNIDFDGESL